MYRSSRCRSGFCSLHFVRTNSPSAKWASQPDFIIIIIIFIFIQDTHITEVFFSGVLKVFFSGVLKVFFSGVLSPLSMFLN